MLSFLIFSVLEVWNKQKNHKVEAYLIRAIPINYYFFYFFSTFSINPKSSIFWDMQNFLHYIKCNSYKVKYNYRFLDEILVCPETIGYGPLTEFLNFGNLNIWNTTLISAIIFFIISIFFIFLSKDNLLLKTAILISPGFHFLFFSLNSDIYVLLFIVLLISKNFKINYLLELFLITFITLIKSYTVFLFIGLITKSLLYKEYKKAVVETAFMIFNIVILFAHYFLNSSLLPEPISFTRTFGVIHDYKIVTQYIGFDEALVIIFLLIGFLILFRNKLYSFHKILNTSKTEIINKLIVLMPFCFFINLYQNWGYKFIFNSIVIFLIYKISNNNFFRFYLILLNIVSITYYSIGWGFEESILNLAILALSKFSFYLYLILSIIIFQKLFITLKNVRY
tara:strand:- start:11023 stop:12207 length:1185 start_codon:yes stop_codon:yes gene_type:complete